MSYTPTRGDIIWLDFEPQQGKEIRKPRPAVVISPQIYNEKVGLALCVPITSKVKNYRFEIKLTLNEIKGVILSDQIRSLDWRVRKARFICKCDNKIIAELVTKLKVLLD